jgi:hypothetical protein
VDAVEDGSISPITTGIWGTISAGWQAGRQAGRQAGSVLKGESYGYRTAHHHHNYTQQFNKLVQHQNNEVEVDVLKKRKLPRNILISSEKNEKDVFSVCLGCSISYTIYALLPMQSLEFFYAHCTFSLCNPETVHLNLDNIHS